MTKYRISPLRAHMKREREERAARVARAVPANFGRIRNSVRAAAEREIEAAEFRGMQAARLERWAIPDEDLGQTEVYA